MLGELGLAALAGLLVVLEALQLGIRLRCGHHRSARGALRVMRLASLVLLWWTIAIGFVSFQRWYFGVYSRCRLPFTYTTSLFFIEGVLAALMLLCCRRQTPCGVARRLGCKRFWSKAAPAGALVALEVALGAVSFEYIDISFHVVVKGCTVIAVLVFSIVFGIEDCDVFVIGCVVAAAAGVVIASVGEGATFRWQGLALTLVASMCNALRWVLSQLLLAPPPDAAVRSGAKVPPSRHTCTAAEEQQAPAGQAEIALATLSLNGDALSTAEDNGASATAEDEAASYVAEVEAEEVADDLASAAAIHDDDLSRPKHGGGLGAAETMLITAPSAVLTLLPIVLFAELPTALRSHGVDAAACTATLIPAVVGGSVLGFTMVLAEFTLLSMTSSLSLTMLATLKDVVLMAIAALVLGESFSAMKTVGVGCAMAGICAYHVRNLARHFRNASGTTLRTSVADDRDGPHPLPTSDVADDDGDDAGELSRGTR